MSLEVKTRYGFLFNGYGPRTYYWEVVILFRKVFLVISTVFLSTISPETQVLSCMFVVFVNIALQIYNKPYYTSTLNRMENFSL